MEIVRVLKNNLLTKKVNSNAFYITLCLIGLIQVSAALYLNDWFHFSEILPASRDLIFKKHEYYRLWTTLFAHADLGHVGSNLLLFIPFAYFLIGHFNFIFFPMFGILVGGFINYFVLMTMPENVYLIGISGVVYWMGAAFITLSYLIDRREKESRRLIKVIGVSLILFFPTVLYPNVSYLSHGLGFIFGVISAAGYYFFNRKQILKEEEYEYLIDDDDEVINELYENQINNQNEIEN